jgi:hypothetical protein
VIQPGRGPLVLSTAQVRGFFDNHVGRTQSPADAVDPSLISLVSQAGQDPAPFVLGTLEIRHP